MEDRLNDLIERRNQLYQAWMIFVLALIASLVLPRVAVRVYGARAYFIALGIVTVVMATLGLILLARTIETWREIRIEKEIKHKREEGEFLLTDDGELTPLIDSDEEDPLKLRRD